jgi:hypothetical protein
MMRRSAPARALLIAFVSGFGVVLVHAPFASAQCAMCGAAAASSRGVARGLAFSIFFLLGTLFLLVSWLVVLVLRSRGGARTAPDAPASVGTAPSIAPAPLPTGHAPARK